MYEYVKKSEYAPVRKELEEIIKKKITSKSSTKCHRNKKKLVKYHFEKL